MSDPIVIVSVARTPMGGFQGDFNSLTAPQLGATAIKAAVERAGIKPEQVEEVVFGNVLQAGVGQAPARQAALGAGLPLSAGCTTIHKVCGSALKSVMMVHDSLLAGSYEIGVAGGQESMSNAPYLLHKARGGYRLGHGQLLDHMFFDGLEDAYQKGRRDVEHHVITVELEEDLRLGVGLRHQRDVVIEGGDLRHDDPKRRRP